MSFYIVLLIVCVRAWFSSRMVANLSISEVLPNDILQLSRSNCIYSWNSKINMTDLPQMSFYNVLWLYTSEHRFSSRMVANLSISAVWSGHLLWLLCSNCICSWTCEINMTYLPLLSFYNVLLIVYVRARACCCVAYVGFKIDHCSSIVYCS